MYKERYLRTLQNEHWKEGLKETYASETRPNLQWLLMSELKASLSRSERICAMASPSQLSLDPSSRFVGKDVEVGGVCIGVSATGASGVTDKAPGSEDGGETVQGRKLGSRARPVLSLVSFVLGIGLG